MLIVFIISFISTKECKLCDSHVANGQRSKNIISPFCIPSLRRTQVYVGVKLTTKQRALIYDSMLRLLERRENQMSEKCCEQIERTHAYYYPRLILDRQ